MGQAAVKSSIVEAVAAVTGGAETLDLKGARAPAGQCAGGRPASHMPPPHMWQAAGYPTVG